MAAAMAPLQVGSPRASHPFVGHPASQDVVRRTVALPGGRAERLQEGGLCWPKDQVFAWRSQ